MTVGQVLIAGAKDCVRRFDITIAYVRSFFDEPTRPGKASMVRLCALIGLLCAREFGVEFVHYIRTANPVVALASILGGFVLTFAVKTAVALNLRTPPDDATDPAPGDKCP